MALVDYESSQDDNDDLPSPEELLGSASDKQWRVKPPVDDLVLQEETPALQDYVAPSAAASQEYGHDMYEFYDPAKGWQGKRAYNFVDDNSGYGLASRTAVRDDSGEHHRPKKRDAPKHQNSEAKARVKQQRRAGQSGIGDDFRIWRSDEEMRLRQQYD